MKNLIVIVLLLICGYIAYNKFLYSPPSASTNGETSFQPAANNEAEFENAFQNHLSNLQLKGSGTVIKILPDDTEGIRHQKFIIRLGSGQTLLIAHNIDMAPRVDSINMGDKINFYGEYEWNAKGGVVHWTHRAPNGSHVAGWLEHNGQRYQ